uniref:Uncharacterized protein n=1 Tax=Rhizophora mucronata TaxID=61149 RepID=A0A2P2QEU1_RHIMU
MEELPSTW